MFCVLRDTGFIKVKIRLEVAAPALLMFWNIPLPEILILIVVYFQKLPDLVHENSNWKKTTFLVILGHCLFLIFSLISQIWILLFRIFLWDFLGLGKRELTCKRGEEKSDWTHTPLFPLSFNFSFEFSSWPCLAKLLYLVEGNWSLKINKTMRSNLFLFFNLCFEYQMFFCVYFHDCLV